jgi:serine/threonine protein kinase
MANETSSAAQSPAKKAAPAPSEAAPQMLDMLEDDAEGNEPTEAFTLDTNTPGGAAETRGKRLADDIASDTLALDEEQLSAAAERVAATVAPTSPAKTSVIGDYKLTKMLGKGGMGSVYKARQISLDRDVALKVLSKDLASHPAFVQRFQREAKMMAKLDHPNILRCYDVREAMGYHFLAMEFVEGGSVQRWLKNLGKFTVGDALHIILAVSRGLEHAHEQGLVHRDIKPDNILLTKKGVIKVADLGLAKATDDDLGLTKTGTGAGTPLYMAPEQARDAKHVDSRCDIYALGAMLYAFLTGQAPFEGTTLVELVEAKEKAKFKPIRSFNTDVPERIDLIVDKMLAKDPKHRYASCTEVVEELESLGLANEQLSFLKTTAGATPLPVKSIPTQAAAASGRTKTPESAAIVTKSGSAKPPAHQEPKVEADIWYWKLKDPGGRTITKKLVTSEVITLIKSGLMDAKAQLSKMPGGGYRASGAYSEFETYFRGKIAEKRAGRGADQYKNMLHQIEEEEARKQRWKSLRKLVSSFGSFVGLVVWLSVLAALIVGAWWLFKKFVP